MFIGNKEILSSVYTKTSQIAYPSDKDFCDEWRKTGQAEFGSEVLEMPFIDQHYYTSRMQNITLPFPNIEYHIFHNLSTKFSKYFFL